MRKGYIYEGACGADIEENWQNDVQFLQCSKGRGLHVDGGCYAEELCDHCPHNPENITKSYSTKVKKNVSRNRSRQ